MIIRMVKKVSFPTNVLGGREILPIVDENPDLNNIVLVATSSQITSYIEMPFISKKGLKSQ